jgi:dTDP-4-amino-4,6-dideoxy-D-galactose acyltransferase
MLIEELKWDSNFFGIKIGRLKLDEPLTHLDELRSICEKNNYKLIYIFSQLRQPVLEKQQILLADQKVTYGKDHHGFALITSPIIHSHNSILDKQLIQLAFLSGTYSRFKKDPHLSPKFEEMYTRWIEGAVSRRLADDVFVAMKDENIAGFVTVSKEGNKGKIGLIAIAEELKGKRMGEMLIQSAEHWYRKNDLKYAEVITQYDNKSACRFYEKNGYTVKSVEYIYHYDFS